MTLSARNAARAAAIRRDPRWARVLARDASADGSFCYSVRTTGVYCRPSCGARTPRAENVAFHATPEAAERAGFRPCRRCHPDQLSLAARQAAWVADICRLIEASVEPLPLARLAAHAGMSASHCHRVFKAVTGLTPRAYAAAQRAQRMRSLLARGDAVTSAIYDAGYPASSRFYAQSGALLGMTPSRYRAGGVEETIRFALGQCSLGAILVASAARGVCAILLGDDPAALLREFEQAFPRAELVGADREYERLVAQVVGLVEAPARGLELPLDIRGSAFRQRVWQALRQIPPGATLSYAELARRIGAPTAVRAVAGACAANLLAVAIPCHRVVRSDGALAGYRWGLARKRTLLAREAPPQDVGATGQDEA